MSDEFGEVRDEMKPRLRQCGSMRGVTENTLLLPMTKLNNLVCIKSSLILYFPSSVRLPFRAFEYIFPAKRAIVGPRIRPVDLLRQTLFAEHMTTSDETTHTPLRFQTYATFSIYNS